jgi:hypothetical protein
LINPIISFFNGKLNVKNLTVKKVGKKVGRKRGEDKSEKSI